ncbi:MAG: hypothetical protein JO341_07785, partial [Gammaproteobacteria bacterium]|nr:hypothetical protein [Gammaproteobacteria bacterium]
MASVPSQLQVGWLRQRLSTIWRSLAAIRHPARSLTGKLMAFVLLTTATALLVAGTSLLATDLYQDRRAWSEQLQSGADILAFATAPALSFDDRTAAQRTLAALERQPAIHAAAIYDARGLPIAVYRRGAAAPPPAQVPVLSPGLHFSGTQGELLQP